MLKKKKLGEPKQLAKVKEMLHEKKKIDEEIQSKKRKLEENLLQIVGEDPLPSPEPTIKKKCARKNLKKN